MSTAGCQLCRYLLECTEEIVCASEVLLQRLLQQAVNIRVPHTLAWHGTRVNSKAHVLTSQTSCSPNFTAILNSIPSYNIINTSYRTILTAHTQTVYPKVTHNNRTSYVYTYCPSALNVLLLRPCTPLHSSCTRDNLNELPRDDGLSCTVVRQGELVYHLTYKYKQKSHMGDSDDISDMAVDR